MSSGTRIVICGGGAIGAAIAYFTSRRGARSTVIERHAVAGAASGKSGGFLALDWCGGPLDRLARRSFELHAELSAELGDPWGYRRLTTYGGYAAEDDISRGAGGRPWLADGVAITRQLGSPETTALVEPRAFTTGLMHAAQAHGAVLQHGIVVDLLRSPSGAVNGILNLTRVCRDRQFQSDPSGVVAVLPAGRTAVRPFHPPLRLPSPPAAWP